MNAPADRAARPSDTAPALRGGASGGAARLRRSPVLPPLIAALVLRVIWIALCPNEPISDQAIYHDGAKNILDGTGFSYTSGDPIGFWPVGYSIALAGMYALFGPHLGAAFALNLIGGLATVLVTYALARDLYDARVGAAAAWAMALYPTFVVYPTVIASENLYNPLWIAAVWLAVKAQRSRHDTWTIVACGLVSGVATLVRPTAFVFPLVVVAAGLLFGPSIGRAVRHTAIVCALVIGLSLPYALRNQRVFGELSFTPFNGGVVLWIGNRPGADGQNVMAEELLAEFTSPEAAKIPLPERNRRLQKVAVDFIIRNPLQFAWLTVMRTFYTLKQETIAIAWNVVGIHRRFGEGAVLPLKIVTSVGYGLLMVAAAAGLWQIVRRRAFGRREILLLVASLAASIPFMVVLGMDRYHLPLIPLVAIFAATLVEATRARVADSGRPQAPHESVPRARTSQAPQTADLSSDRRVT
jgi:4-amino-4-deoxy-L-arabinose transferase-like glycosyltransferase